MTVARLADQVNRLPWETWLREDMSALWFGLPPEEAAKVLRAGRRVGSLTVRRAGDAIEYKRVRRHP